MTSTRPSLSPAVDETLAILRLLSERAGPMPAGAIARALGLPRSTTYKLLGILAAHDFVTHLPEERRYALGVAAFELGSAYSRQDGIARLARPLLARLVDETTHSGHVAVPHGADVLYVAEERAPGRPTLVTDVGVRLPAHLTASGRALLALLPAAQVRALYPDAGAFVHRHAPGLTRLSELRRELQAVRTRGFALETDSVTPGLASVACASVDRSGRPQAAIALTYPVEHVADPSGIARRVAAYADELTRRLGGTMPARL